MSWRSFLLSILIASISSDSSSTIPSFVSILIASISSGSSTPIPLDDLIINVKLDGSSNDDYQPVRPEEQALQTGQGDVLKWIKKVGDLSDWERSLILGNAYINTSARMETSRAKFTLGLLAVHNFLYEPARQLFKSALDYERRYAREDFPMANWGIALASKYMFWSSSNCETGKKAVMDIPDNYREQVTEKEAAFIKWAYALFPPDKTCKDDTEDNRETRFAEAAIKFVVEYPNDLEGKLWYGLGKLATLNHDEYQYEGPKYDEGQEAKQLLRTLFDLLHEKHPTHSGPIHYSMHVYDTPVIFGDLIEKFLRDHIEPEKQNNDKAANGIRAAYTYPEVAKSSCHGLHMPSHIYLRTGNWKMSLKSNLVSIKVGDESAAAQSKDFAYDKENLYHSVEYAQNDFLQLGRYKEANQQFKRMKEALRLQWEASDYQMDKNVRFFLELVFRMRARSVLDPYTGRPIKGSYGKDTCIPEGETVINDEVSGGEMTYTAISEAGAMLTSGIAAVIDNSDVWRICMKGLSQMAERLKDRKYKETMIYTKKAVDMIKEQLNAVVEMIQVTEDSVIEPSEIVTLKRAFEKTTAIQDNMKQTYLTITLLFVPSYELYGQVLLMLREYEKAAEMFQKSILNTMGRTNSLIGLARSYAMLGREEDADYFYGYVKKQLVGADAGNVYLEEVEVWFRTKSREEIRAFFRWPLVNTY